MPTWATILIALAGAAAGATAATVVAWMRINFEREESLRSRMLDAADDYSASATRAANSLYRAVNVVEFGDLRDEHGNIDSSSEEASRLRDAVDEARPLVNEARAHFSRVQLLFGTDTPTGRAASILITTLFQVVRILDDAEVRYAHQRFNDSTQAHDVFTREARRALLRPSLRDPEGALAVDEELEQEMRRVSEPAEKAR